MIDWSQTQKGAGKALSAVVDRAKDLSTFRDFRDWPGLLMDVHASTADVPLDFEAWMAADDYEFAHDLAGIYQHFNRRTGRLDGGFTPRFALANQ